MKHLRRTCNTSEAIEYYSTTHLEVNSILREAINRVHPRLEDAADIRIEGQLKSKIKQAALTQDSTTVNDLLNLNRNRN